MKTTALYPINTTRTNTTNPKLELIEFYDEATRDYKFWSKDYNMHFGYWTPLSTNPFRRDTMLNELNNQVLKRLNLKRKKAFFADLGCGMGGTMRYAMKKNKHLSSIGVTLSETQVREGNKLLKDYSGAILKENYNRTSFKSNSVDGAVAIESFCHSGHDKNSFKEAYRILKPDGKLVISDAFLKKNTSSFGFSSRFCYQRLCNSWSIERLGVVDDIVEELKDVGFQNIVVEDISMRVGPSVLHVPFAITGFALRQLLKSGTLNKQSVNNLKGSFFALLSGLHLRSFGYFLITCTK